MQPIGNNRIRSWKNAAPVSRFEIPAFPLNIEYFTHRALKDALIGTKLKASQLGLDVSDQDPAQWHFVSGITTGNGPSVTECEENVLACTTMKSLVRCLNLGAKDMIVLNMACFLKKEDPKAKLKRGTRPIKKVRKELLSSSDTDNLDQGRSLINKATIKTDPLIKTEPLMEAEQRSPIKSEYPIKTDLKKDNPRPFNQNSSLKIPFEMNTRHTVRKRSSTVLSESSQDGKDLPFGGLISSAQDKGKEKEVAKVEKDRID